MSEKRRICIVTGSRADFGLLSPVMKAVAEDDRLELQVVATGSHLAPVHGETVREIEAAGFTVAARVEMLLSSDSGTGVAKSIGLGTIGLADAYDRLRPHIVVLLGDRFETLAAAQAAMALRIPIAHIHGGEATYGLIDEAIRHAVTKMAHLHFVAAEPYRRRVIQLGEEPGRVYDFGAPGLDAVRATAIASRSDLEQALGFALGQPALLVTYHPVTLVPSGTDQAFRALVGALDRFPDSTVLFTRSNADTRGSDLNRLIDDYAASQPGRVRVATSLGSRLYLAAVSHCDVVVGNSSSGLYEAPLLGTPTVNIGDRQAGRLKPASVIDCGEREDDIAQAVQRALSRDHQDAMATMKLPYGDGNAAPRIAEVLATVSLDGLLLKHFFDVQGIEP